MASKNSVKHKNNQHQLLIIIKKTPVFILRFLFLILAEPTFPSRLQLSIIGAVDFTAVFGMVTGVSPQQSPPGNF